MIILKDIFGLVFIFILFLSSQAEAYLDPGTGSMFLQIVIASIAAVALWIKMSWQSIKLFLGNLFKKESNLKEDE